MSVLPSLSVVICASAGDQLEQTVAAATVAAARHSAEYEVVIAAGPVAAESAARAAAARPLVYATYHRQPRPSAYLLRDACALTSGELILALDAATPPSAAAIERLLSAYNGQDVIAGMRTPMPSHPVQRAHIALLRRILVSDQVDPLLPLALFRAELIDLLPGDGELAPPLAHLYAVARRRGYTTMQIALPAQGAPAHQPRLSELASLVAQGPARGASPALGALVVVGSLWLLLRRRR